MRFQEFKSVVTENTVNDWYILGDSHARALGGSKNYARNGSNLARVERQLDDVMSGSMVVLSVGHNDAVDENLDPQNIADQIADMIRLLQGNTYESNVLYMLFPEGNGRGNKAETRDAILRTLTGDATPSFGILDIGRLPMGSDGEHANFAAYRAITNYLPRLIEQREDDESNSQSDSQSPGAIVTQGKPYRNRELVLDMQRKLQVVGFNVGPMGADGKYGPYTGRAVANWKTSVGITPASGSSMTQEEYDQLMNQTEVTGDAQLDVTRSSMGTTVPGDGSPEYPPGLSMGAIERMITQESSRRNIDADVAVGVFRSEGYGSYQSSITSGSQLKRNGREASYGPYQLYVGGGMGNDYERDTGRDLRTDNTEEGILNQVRYALDKAATGSWRPWYGFRAAYPGQPFRYGLSGARPARNWS